MKCLVATPYSVDSLSGNSVCARRIVSLLQQKGVDAAVVSSVELESASDQESCAELNSSVSRHQADVLIALHARKSAAALEAYLAANPTGKTIVFLTGTDLYGDIPSGSVEAMRALTLACMLVVSQEASLDSIPSEFRHKARVIHKSISIPANLEADRNQFENDKKTDWRTERTPREVTMLGHLRAVKRPLDTLEALKLVDIDLTLNLIGGSYDEALTKAVQQWQDRDQRVRWLGELPRERALEHIQNSYLTVNTSEIEGGANSIGESVMLGVPVLASAIEGNRGMLGDDYQGYFPCGDVAALSELLKRTFSEKEYYRRLQEQVLARQSLFSAQREQDEWLCTLGVL